MMWGRFPSTVSVMWGRCPRHSRCDVGQVPQAAQSPHWPPPPLAPLGTETSAGRSSASLTHCSFLPYWTYLTPSYWTGLTPSYWTDLTPSYWTVLTPSYSPGPRYRRGQRCQGRGREVLETVFFGNSVSCIKMGSCVRRSEMTTGVSMKHFSRDRPETNGTRSDAVRCDSL